VPDSRRELTSLLAEPERRLLTCIARRMPARLGSDAFTAPGVVGAAGAGLAHALTSRSPGWLWAASLLLAINWLGDSLDGTLARVRRVERPRYGYYLDHLVDATATAAVGIGLGLSPWVDLELALLLVVAYPALSIDVYLESTVFGVFRLGYSRIGPTEARILLIGLNTLLFFVPARSWLVEWVPLLADGLVFALAAVMLGMLAARSVRNLELLGQMEKPWPPTSR
jgi:phosphatidylglycerophosphate synthase